jgi:hypothetical protein
VQSGQTRPALDYIELAERHPATREQALALRARIGIRDQGFGIRD